MYCWLRKESASNERCIIYIEKLLSYLTVKKICGKMNDRQISLQFFIIYYQQIRNTCSFRLIYIHIGNTCITVVHVKFTTCAR